MNILAMARGPQVEEGALDNKVRMGHNLFRLAWMVEIIAAGIDLLIALTIVLQSIGADSVGAALGATTMESCDLDDNLCEVQQRSRRGTFLSAEFV